MIWKLHVVRHQIEWNQITTTTQIKSGTQFRGNFTFKGTLLFDQIAHRHHHRILVILLQRIHHAVTLVHLKVSLETRTLPPVVMSNKIDVSTIAAINKLCERYWHEKLYCAVTWRINRNKPILGNWKNYREFKRNNCKNHKRTKIFEQMLQLQSWAHFLSIENHLWSKNAF